MDLLHTRSLDFCRRIKEYCRGNEQLSRLTKGQRGQISAYLREIWGVSDKRFQGRVEFDGLDAYVRKLKTKVPKGIFEREFQLVWQVEQRLMPFFHFGLGTEGLHAELQGNFDSQKTSGRVVVVQAGEADVSVMVTSLSGSQSAVLRKEELVFQLSVEDMCYPVYVTFKFKIRRRRRGD